MIKKIKGTQDFLDTKNYRYFINKLSKQLLLYNYNFIMTPILESLELFQRSLGENTDVVSKEMYLAFNSNSSEKACLRPEATAGVVRAFLENGVHNQVLPWKVFTYGPMFRYERPQKGRYRQFHQVSIECIGAASIDYDVELISMLYDLFVRKIEIEDTVLEINYLGSKEDRVNHREALIEFLKQNSNNICDTCKERAETNTLRVFDCKSESCQAVYENAPIISDYLTDESKKEWFELQESLRLLSVNFIENSRLVRGLDYYNKTVFEFSSRRLGAQSTFCGGGRYDGLITQFSPKDFQPALGAGIGIERVLMLLEPEEFKSKLIAVLPLSKEQNNLALLVAEEIRNSNIKVETILDVASIKSLLRKASKMDATAAIIIGDDEQATQTLTVKNLVDGNSAHFTHAEAFEYLKSI